MLGFGAGAAVGRAFNNPLVREAVEVGMDGLITGGRRVLSRARAAYTDRVRQSDGCMSVAHTQSNSCRKAENWSKSGGDPHGAPGLRNGDGPLDGRACYSLC